MSDLIEQHFLALTFVMVCFWALGLFSGIWWERIKNDDLPDQDDEIWW